MLKHLNKKYNKITSVLKQCEHLGKKAEKTEWQPAENRETFFVKIDELTTCIKYTIQYGCVCDCATIFLMNNDRSL
jgi:hypothetical protein